MPPRTWELRVRDILTSIVAIEDYAGAMSYEEFRRDRKTVDAVLRNLEIIGEAAANVPPAVQGQHPDIPWDEMRRIRNVVVHVYFGVNLPIVWRTIQDDLAPLKAQLEAMLGEGD